MKNNWRFRVFGPEKYQ